MAQHPDDHRFLEIWKDATRKYEADTEIKFTTHPLAGCNNPDAVLDALDRDLQKFEEYCGKKKNLRKWLKPMLHLIGSLSESAGEAAGGVRTYSLLDVYFKLIWPAVDHPVRKGWLHCTRCASAGVC
jgi:hypothetical protein